MIYKKRFIRAVLIALSGTFLLTGCGNDSSNTEKPPIEKSHESSKNAEIPKIDSKTTELEEAQKTFINYHKAITNQNYHEAYELLSEQQKKVVGDYDSWILGFADTLTSEVSAMTLTSSEENAYTFDYTLTARDRHSVGNVKVQVFEGQVTMAKDKGKWYVRSSQSSQVDERIVEELEKAQKVQLESEQKKREEKLANTSAEKNLEQATKLSANTSVKEYLETIQPFVLVDLIKKVSGIAGLLEDGSNERLEKYIMAMSLLAENERARNTEISRNVANYFEYEAQIAAAYVSAGNKGLKEKAVIYAMIYKLGREQSKIEEKIYTTAKGCGADLSNFAETDIIRRIINIARNL